MRKHKDTIEWAAGIFEGEGNIYRNDNKKRIGSGSIFIMSVQMKDEDVVKRFHRIVNYGKIIKRKPYKNYAPMWEWRLTRTNNILDLCHKLLPFMGKRRTKQIRKAIKGKVYIKPRRKLKATPLHCEYMKKGEISNRGAHYHIRKGEKPCLICAYNQRLYYQQWRKAFYEANK